MRNIQQLVAMHARQNQVNGLPCGNYTYSDPLKIENRYQGEGGVIREKFGTIANWRLWNQYTVTERASGRTVFENEIAKITGMSLHNPPRIVLEALDKSIYEIRGIL